MKRLWIAALVSWTVLVSVANAAPFCVATSFGENCWYYNRESCEQAARNARGACILNQEEMARRQQQQLPSFGVRPIGAPFCVVTSFGNQCFYYDEPSCQRAARSSNGYCVYNR